MDTELHITVKHAGDPEKLSQLLKSAISVQETIVKVVVPAGYRCVECDSGDGEHFSGCSMNLAGREVGE